MAVKAPRRSGEAGTRMPAFKKARYQRILDAALEVLHQEDYEQIKVDDVARRAGLAKATLYRYFPSKDQLYAVVLRQWAEQEHQRPLPSSDPGTARARVRAEAEIAAYERHPQFFRLDVRLFASEEPEVRAELSALAARSHQLYAGDFAAHGTESPHDAAVILRAIARTALTNAVFHAAPFSTVRHRVSRLIDLYEPPAVPSASVTPPVTTLAPVADERLSGFREARRDRIVHTALDALKAQPYEQIHVSQIAQRAGISLGTVYRYFPSKEHLYAVVVREWFRTSRFLLPFDGLPTAERIRARVSAAIDAFEAHPQIFRLNHALYSAADPVVHAIVAEVASSARGRLSDDFRVLGVADPGEVSAMLWAILDSLTQAALSYNTSFAEVHRIAGAFVTLVNRHSGVVDPG